jgi:hypothetical protein
MHGGRICEKKHLPSNKFGAEFFLFVVLLEWGHRMKGIICIFPPYWSHHFFALREVQKKKEVRGRGTLAV